MKNTVPEINDIWVVNLDKDTERWNNIHTKTKKYADKVHRWSASYGKNLKHDEILKYGVRGSISGYDKEKPLLNPGIIGCWLSHKLLLQYLSTLDVPDNHCHLIFEDDIDPPTDLFESTHIWHTYKHQIPSNYDMVYFDIGRPNGYALSEHVFRLMTIEEMANWGTYAYLVRHGALKHKIVPWLEYMVDSIDNQLNLKFDEWNVYLLRPGIISLNSELSKTSTITTL